MIWGKTTYSANFILTRYGQFFSLKEEKSNRILTFAEREFLSSNLANEKDLRNNCQSHNAV